MWPLLIVNYVKLIELKRLLVYSKESCNNLANIIHGHRRFRLKRPLNDLHSAATGADQEGTEEEEVPGVWCLMVTLPSPGADTHTMSQYQGLTPESGSGMWHDHALSQITTHSQTRHCLCILDNAGLLLSCKSLGPGQLIISHHTRLASLQSWLWAMNCYYWLSQPARPSPRSPAPWWGQKSTLKIFLLRTK